MWRRALVILLCLASTSAAVADEPAEGCPPAPAWDTAAASHESERIGQADEPVFGRSMASYTAADEGTMLGQPLGKNHALEPVETVAQVMRPYADEGSSCHELSRLASATNLTGANDDLTSSGGLTPAREAENRVTKVRTAHFVHDAFGETMTTTSPGVASLDEVGGDYGTTNGPVARHITGVGPRGGVAERMGTTTHRLEIDRLGSSQAMTDDTAAIAESPTYQPYDKTIEDVTGPVEFSDRINPQRVDMELTYLAYSFGDREDGPSRGKDPEIGLELYSTPPNSALPGAGGGGLLLLLPFLFDQIFGGDGDGQPSTGGGGQPTTGNPQITTPLPTITFPPEFFPPTGGSDPPLPPVIPPSPPVHPGAGSGTVPPVVAPGPRPAPGAGPGPGAGPAVQPLVSQFETVLGLGGGSTVPNLLENFLTGTGPEQTIHGPNDILTQQMVNAPGVNFVRMIHQATGGEDAEGFTDYPAPFGLVGTGGLVDVPKIFGVRFIGLDGLLSSANLTRQFVGSYNVTIINGPGRRRDFFVKNTTSFTSLSYQLGLPSWPRSTFRPMGTTRQLFYWSEEW